jgi:hypothetical protein
VKLEGAQLVLDANILVHWMCGSRAGAKLRADYELGGRRPQPIIPVVVKAEIKSLALQFGWGADKRLASDELLPQPSRRHLLGGRHSGVRPPRP